MALENVSSVDPYRQAWEDGSMCALNLRRSEHPRAREVAAWMQPRLVGALREVNGAQSAQAVLRRAALQYGSQAALDALDIIHRDAVSGV